MHLISLLSPKHFRGLLQLPKLIPVECGHCHHPGATFIECPISAGHFASPSSKAVHKAWLLLAWSLQFGREKAQNPPIQYQSPYSLVQCHKVCCSYKPCRQNLVEGAGEEGLRQSGKHLSCIMETAGLSSSQLLPCGDVGLATARTSLISKAAVNPEFYIKSSKF